MDSAANDSAPMEKTKSLRPEASEHTRHDALRANEPLPVVPSGKMVVKFIISARAIPPVIDGRSREKKAR
jgi:hypothetical protein